MALGGVYREKIKNPVTGQIEEAEFDHPATPDDIARVMDAMRKAGKPKKVDPRKPMDILLDRKPNIPAYKPPKSADKILKEQAAIADTKNRQKYAQQTESRRRAMDEVEAIDRGDDSALARQMNRGLDRSIHVPTGPDDAYQIGKSSTRRYKEGYANWAKYMGIGPASAEDALIEVGAASVPLLGGALKRLFGVSGDAVRNLDLTRKTPEAPKDAVRVTSTAGEAIPKPPRQATKSAPGPGAWEEVPGRDDEWLSGKKRTTPPRQQVDPESTMATQNSLTEALRKDVGLPGFEDVPKQSFKQWANEAAQKGYNKSDVARANAQKVLSGQERGLTPAEDLGIAARLTDAGDEFGELSAKLERVIGTPDEKDIVSRLNQLTTEIDELTKATKMAGSDAARRMVARRGQMRADGTFAGMYAEKSEAFGGKLPTHEIEKIAKDSEEFKRLTKEIEDLKIQNAANAAELELKVRSATRRHSSNVRERRTEIRTRIGEKWKKSAPRADAARIDLFGVGYTAEQAARLAQIAPDVLELLHTYADEGIDSLKAATPKIRALLKEEGVDVTDRDIHAMIAHRGERAERELTAYQQMKAEAAAVFKRERDENLSAIKTAKAEKDATKRAAAAEWEAKERIRKQAEKEFWADVKRQESAFRKGQKKDLASSRAAYVKFWKASPGGQKASLLNRIDAAAERLRVMREEGIIPGQKSKLPVDAKLRDLEIKQQSIIIQSSKEAQRLKLQQQGMEPLQAISNALSVPRTLKSMGDISAPLQQGGLAMLTHTKSWKDAWAPTIQVITKEGFDKYTAGVKLRSNFDSYVVGGLDMPALTTQPGEEFIVSRLIDDVPGLAQIKQVSEQEYAAFLTELRTNMFDEMVEVFGRGKPLSAEELKWIGRSVNTWTGRGKWTKGLDPALSQPFFAINYWSSLFESGLGRPMFDAIGVWKRTGNSKPFTYAAKKYLRGLSLGAGVLYATGAEMNPQSVNFGRIVREDGTTTDVLPPQLAQPLRFLAQQLTGTRIKADGEVQEGFHARAYSGWSMFEAKEAPFFKLLMNLKEGESFGKSLDLTTPEGWGNMASELLEPISSTNMREIITSPKLTIQEKLAGALFSLFGRAPNIPKE